MPETMEEEGRVVPVTIRAIGVIDKNIRKYVGRIPGYHNIYSL